MTNRLTGFDGQIQIDDVVIADADAEFKDSWAHITKEQKSTFGTIVTWQCSDEQMRELWELLHKPVEVQSETRETTA